MIQQSTCPVSPLPNYGLPTRLAPRWYVGYLTFQYGNPHRRTESLTGSGVIPPKSFDATFQPVMSKYETATQSLVGSGNILGAPFEPLNLLPQPDRRRNQVGGVS
jgi:hypothetical protein